MPPRRAAKWDSTAPEETLIRAFCWEISQAFKPAFLYHLNVNYNQLVKMTFLRNYTEKVPLARLRQAAIDGFAPPAQRLCIVLARVLMAWPLPPEIGQRVLDFLPGWPTGLTPREVHRLCAMHFLGPLTRKAGKLTMTLPKDGDFTPPATGPRSQTAAATAMMQSALAQRAQWWNIYPPDRHHFVDVVETKVSTVKTRLGVKMVRR